MIIQWFSFLKTITEGGHVKALRFVSEKRDGAAGGTGSAALECHSKRRGAAKRLHLVSVTAAGDTAQVIIDEEVHLADSYVQPCTQE